jgi:cathepsin L
MDQAFQYVISNHGIDTEASYPYTATGPNQCRFNRAHVAATFTSFHDVPQGDENALVDAAYKTPTSVAIDASHQSFQFYSSGVYYEPNCSPTQLDHGVLAVGWGVSGSSNYWIVKNSWGASWGNQGYIWMSRNRNNNCGIATAASYPIV